MSNVIEFRFAVVRQHGWELITRQRDGQIWSVHLSHF